MEIKSILKKLGSEFAKEFASGVAEGKIEQKRTAEEGLKEFFSKYNCQYKEESKEENDYTRYTFDYQGGHFIAFIYNNTKGAEFVFPRIFDVPLEHLNTVRSMCNRSNSLSIAYKFSYNINEEENIVAIGISFFMPIVEADALSQLLANCFSEQREFIDGFKNALENAKERSTSDVERTFANNSREIFLLRQQEIAHQPHDDNGYHYDAASPFTIEHLIYDLLNRKDVMFKSLNVVEDGNISTITDVNEIKGFNLFTAMLNCEGEKPEFTHNDATIVAHYTTPLSESADEVNVLTISLKQAGVDDNTYYMYATTTIDPLAKSRRNSLSNKDNTPDSITLLMGYDTASTKQKQAEFDYMWKDAKIKIEEDKTSELTDEQRLIYDISDANIGYNLYWGRHYMNKERYFEAITYFENAYNALRPIFFTLSKETKQSFFDLCYDLGFCYCDLHLYEKAFFYLDIVNGYGRIDYAMEYVNILANAKDVRIFNVTDNIMHEIRDQYNEDDEIPEKIQSFINFLRRRRAYAFIDFGNLDEAEKMFKELLDDPESRDYAINELAYIQSLRGTDEAPEESESNETPEE